MLKNFFYKFSLETGVTIVLWMSLCTGIIMMLSPSYNMTYQSYYPPEEVWNSMERMQQKSLNFWENRITGWNKLIKKYRPIFNDEQTELKNSGLKTQSMPILKNSGSTTNFNQLLSLPNVGRVAVEMNFGTTGVSWINIPLGFIQIFVSGYGLYGIYEEEGPKYLLPYIAWNVIYPTITIVLNIFSPMGAFYIWYLMSLFQLGLYIYFLLIIYSYYSTIPRTVKRRSYGPLSRV